MWYHVSISITSELSRLRKSPNFRPPTPMPLSVSCQTPKVVNPSVMRTTVVVLRSSRINCSLMALSCQSWSTYSWCVSVGGGGGGLMGLTKATCIQLTGQGANYSFEGVLLTALTRNFRHELFHQSLRMYIARRQNYVVI